jgi:hypothetical protein
LKWLKLLCAGFAGGCKEAAAFTLFGWPLRGWGIVYYMLMAVSRFKAMIDEELNKVNPGQVTQRK